MIQKLLFLLLFTLALPLQAQGKFKVPALSGPVIDEVGVISPQDKAQIENLLYDFNRRGIAQVQVYVTSSLQGLPIEQASIEIVDQWKLGTKEKDNGLLFLIAPHEKKLRMEVGQGLEGVMPDVYTKRISEDLVVPYFKKNQMSQGILQGVKAILTVLNGGDLQAPAPPSQDRNSRKVPVPFAVIVLMWIIIMILGRMGGGGGGGRRFRGGYWIGGGGFGGGGFGGGGGWSGGGGGFSGGGSSSSW